MSWSSRFSGCFSFISTIFPMLKILLHYITHIMYKKWDWICIVCFYFVFQRYEVPMEGEQDNTALTFVFAQHTHSPLFGARSHLFAAALRGHHVRRWPVLHLLVVALASDQVRLKFSLNVKSRLKIIIYVYQLVWNYFDQTLPMPNMCWATWIWSQVCP